MTIPRWRQRLQPPYSLDTIILVTAIGVLSLLALVYIVFSYERLGRETMESTRRWSESVADLVASSSAGALAVQDLAGIESNMQQLAALPGIDNIALLRTDGRTSWKSRAHPAEPWWRRWVASHAPCCRRTATFRAA